MGTRRTSRNNRYQGISRLDPRWTYTRIRAKGANPEDSSYTSQGARAGIPEPQQTSSMDLKASGPQGDDGDLELLTQRAGHPLPDAGGFVVRDVAKGDSTSQYLGHDGYQVITGWDGSLRYDTTGSGGTQRTPVIRLLSGDLLLAENNSITPIQIHRMDADTGTWSLASSIALFPGTSDQTPGTALLQIPSGRILLFYVDRGGLQVHVVYSDDDGTTWSDYATSVLSASTASEIAQLSVAYTRGSMVLFTDEGLLGPGQIQQWVSYDLGATFAKVGSGWPVTAPQEFPGYISLVGLPSGQLVMLYWWVGAAGPGSEVYSVRTLDPSTPAYLGPKLDLYVAPDAPAWSEAACALWVDEDGLLYGLHEVQEGASAYTMLIRSEDGGASWTTQKSPVLTMGAVLTERPHNYSVASTGGRAAWVMRWASAGAAAGQSLAVAYLGGHSWVTVGSVDDGTDEFDARSFVGWGQELVGDVRFGGGWLPFNDPVAMGWTQLGPGAIALVSPSRWQLTTTTNTVWYRKDDPASKPSIGAVNAGFLVTVVSGGSLLTPVIGIRLRISNYDSVTPANATAINEITVNMTTTGFRVYDAISGLQLGVDVSYDLTQPTWFLIALRRASGGQGEAAVWYGRPGGPARRLILALALSTLADDAAANPTNSSRVEWGNLATGTGQSQWEAVGYSFAAGPWQPNLASNYVASWSNPQKLRGRDHSTLPALLLDRVKVQATDGPTRLGELWRIKTRYDYGVANLHPRLSPSPRVPWRSKTDGVTERIVWDLESGLFTDAYMGNHALLFLLIGANIRDARILGWDVAGAAWDVLANLDASDGFQALPWERAGSTVRPDNAQVGVGERYLWRHQHAGDTYDLNSGENPLQRIQTNTEGAWRVDGTGAPKVKQPVIWLEKGLKAGAPASGLNGEIWCRDFGGLVREYVGKYQRFALEIPAQKTVDGYYQVGALFVGDLLVFAQQYDLGWVWTRSFNAEIQDRTDGTRRVRTLGPMRRAVEVAWVETAVQTYQEQADSPDPDWIRSGDAASLPVASRGDVVRAVTGLLEQQGGPAEPLVYLSRVPEQAQGTTAPLLLTDRRRWLYGRVQTQPKTEVLAARKGEAVDEVERLNKITIEEEV